MTAYMVYVTSLRNFGTILFAKNKSLDKCGIRSEKWSQYKRWQVYNSKYTHYFHCQLNIAS